MYSSIISTKAYSSYNSTNVELYVSNSYYAELSRKLFQKQ